MNDIIYSQMNNVEQEHWWFCGKRKIVFDIIINSTFGGDKFCDLGCGIGIVLKEIKDKNIFKSICGYDYSKEARDYSSNKVDCPLYPLNLNE